MSEYLRT